MGLCSDNNCHLVDDCRHTGSRTTPSTPNSHLFPNTYGLFFICYYSSFCYLCFLHLYIYQSPLQWSSSTPWCSRCEGKKTDQYSIFCDYYIFIDLVSTCCERKSVGFSYPGILQPFLAVMVSYWHDHTSNLLCQFNSKSHNLRPADARIKSGYITTIPQESNSFKPGRSTASKSLVQPKVSVLMTVKD